MTDGLLSRLCITGKLDPNTPLELILDIAEAHGIDYSYINSPSDINKILIEINKENVWKLAKVKTDADYEKMALFLNPYVNVPWDRNQLEAGILFYKSFTNPKEFSKLSPDFEFGNQTPDGLNLLNGCVVYAAAKYFGLELEQSDTIETMVYKLRGFLTSSEYLTQSINNRLMELDNRALLHIDYLIYEYINKLSNRPSTSKSDVTPSQEVPKILPAKSDVIPTKEVSKVVPSKNNITPVQEVPKVVPIKPDMTPSKDPPRMATIKLDVIPLKDPPKVVPDKSDTTPLKEAPKVVTIKPDVVPLKEAPKVIPLKPDMIPSKDPPKVSTLRPSEIPTESPKEIVPRNIPRPAIIREELPQDLPKNSLFEYIVPTYKELEKLSTDIGIMYPNEEALLSYNVKTHTEAIVIGSLCYGYNLINEKNPLETFDKIKGPFGPRSRSSGSDPGPLEVLELIKSNKEFPTSVLDFNGDYPISMYKSTSLRRMLKEKGYSDSELDIMNKSELFELLQVISLSNDFYPGKKVPYKNIETPFDLQDVKDLSENECISFGSRDDITVFTYQELYNFYNTKKILVDPLKPNDLLTVFNIKKLMKICDSVGPGDEDREHDRRSGTGDRRDRDRKRFSLRETELPPTDGGAGPREQSDQGSMRGPGATQSPRGTSGHEGDLDRRSRPGDRRDQMNERPAVESGKGVNDWSKIKIDLRRLILDLDNQQIDADNQIYDIMNKIKEDKTETMRNAVEHFMRMLVELSMNMRGWNGKGGYPIRNIHELGEKLIDQRVNESLHDIDLYVENFPFPCSNVLRLPLVKYQNSKYVKGDSNNGRTILDRLGIVRNSQKDVYACIKLSSNWLASSAYKYSKILGIDPGFNIEDFKLA